jgi:HEAT repeat protein
VILNHRFSSGQVRVKGKHWLQAMALSTAAAAAMPTVRAAAQPPAAAAPAPQEQIDELRATLFDSNRPARERDEAARRLLQREAYDVLLEALRSGKSDLQVPVARALAEQENPPAVFLNDLMTRCLQAQVTAELAEAASQAVANYRDNPAARARLRDFILSDNIPEGVRLPAVKALGTLNDKDTAKFLVETVLNGTNQRLSDAAADALVQMTGQAENGRDVGLWNQWWGEQRFKSSEQFLAERRAERERRFSQANAGLQGLASGVDKLMFDLHRRAKDDAEREELVLRCLNDPYPEIRSAGARLIEQERAEGLTVRPAVRGRLRELIGDSSPDVRQKVALAIKSINDTAAAKPLLAQLQQERFPAVKAALMAALGPMKDVSAVPVLIKQLDDTSNQVAEAAARALADLGPEIAKSRNLTRDVANALVRTINRTKDQRGSTRLRENVVAATVPLKDPALVKTLFSLLDNRLENSTNVRRSAIRALAAMGDTPQREDIAQRIAETPLNDYGEGAAGVRLEAAAALGLVGGEAQANALYQHMYAPRETDQYVRDEAWKSLSSLFADFPVVTLLSWAEVNFKDQPDKQTTVYLVLNDKLIPAGASETLATVQERLGTLYLKDNPEKAIGYLAAALNFWDAKGPGMRTESIQSKLMEGYLRARRYKDAMQYAADRIRIGGNPNRQVMGGAIMREVAQLERSNELKDLKAALELLGEAKNLDLGNIYNQQVEERYRAIAARVPAFLERWTEWWNEIVA